MKYLIMREFCNCLILTVALSSSEYMGKCTSVIYVPDQVQAEELFQNNSDAKPKEIDELNILLKNLLEKGDFYNSRIAVERIVDKIDSGTVTDSLALSGSYYFIGIHYLLTKNYFEAIRFLKLSASLKEDRKEYDNRYSKTLYNIGVAYNGLGDFTNQERYSVNSLEVEKRIYGESSPQIIGTYLSLIVAYIEMHEYEKSLVYANIALNIAGSNPGSVSPADMADLYNNLGVLYILLADYSKAKIYLEKSQSIYQINQLDLDDNYFNLVNSMAITYGALGFSEKSNEYYEKGIDLALSQNYSSAYNNINSYSIILGNKGNPKKGEFLLRSALARAKANLGEDSPVYFMVLFNYAEYLREYKIDNNKSLEYYKMCLDYLGKNARNLFLKDPVTLGYAQSLAESGEPRKALEMIQSLLFSENNNTQKYTGEYGYYRNPALETIKADRKSLKIFRTKYNILWKAYEETPDQKLLEAASLTARLIVGLLEKVRINISEEESRLVLGDRYRNSYLNAIRDFNLLYNRTGDHNFLEDAFEFLEKSKVAGLLASTRELKAAQFNIPKEIADLEIKLQRDIALFNARIAEEIETENVDTVLISTWREWILKYSRMKDSLLLVFEKKYPGYYSFKYNTQTIKLDEIPELIGRNVNYINYVVSDTLLYIFVANRKKQQLLAIPIDSSFFSGIRQFRSLLSKPSPSVNARTAFDSFMITGYRLYKTFIEPVRPYLISNKLLISPDNILSYIPFETIPTSTVAGNRILYNQIPYMMNEFDISYTYSATFMAESVKRAYSFRNKLIAFAPNYSDPIDIQSVVMNRPTVVNKLPEIPYARQEAEYVSDITHGILYENHEAKESVYKIESGKYDIIHLAMHTILNDKDPMYSTLVFSSENDSTNDRYLKTYEVYNIPLKAKMVVLSSCNTGTGLLYSGEGILSLARGFTYSGSESVVMSTWEIEDRSGTEIVKRFYENLKNGNSKSVALKKARLEYLKGSDQLRSHPYFWAALVIYGKNNPLYYPKYLFIALSITGIIVVFCLAVYFRRPKCS